MQLDHESRGMGTPVRGKFGVPTSIPKRGHPHRELAEAPKQQPCHTDRFPYGKALKVATFNTGSILKVTFQQHM
eukprot:5610148-Alexandrium_andersonii.AAC.1